ncbi:Single-stranded DNA-binding protein [hydrothermal vent metagenome]|uniref:Single-stranded DNA-binding protein n=1 Tax=hydrothermal vent metagenome TaxID=652676 RepID=A0A1W1D030_9ZZZZ
MYNKIILIGHLTKDLEVKYTQSGTAIANTGIATNRKFKSQMGEQKEEVLFVDIAFFGRTAEIANQYLRKGSKILVEGRLKLDQWTAPDGMKRSKHSVIVETMKMLDTKGTNPSDNYGGNGGGYGQENAPAQNNYNQAPTQPSYNQPQQNNYGQAEQNTYNQAPAQPSYNQAPSTPAPVPQQPTHSIPSIDIDEDEIPF